MIPEIIESKSDYSYFQNVCRDVYKNNIYYRGTEQSIENLLLNSNTAFKKNARIIKFVVRDGNTLVARFALIKDSRQKDCVMVSFFEAQDGLGDVFSLIKEQIIKHFPDTNKVVVGLNGHLNYGAGILLNRFDEPPLFGLNYNPEYYKNYFKNLHPRKMYSFRFGMDAYNAWAKIYNVHRAIEGLTLRFMDKRKIKDESAVYTRLNNESFVNHPFWANRSVEEDQELFYPFRFLLDNENLIFAEINGNPVGFFLWYPDINQMIKTQRDISLFDVVKFRIRNNIDTFRFTEIGIIPKYQRSPVALALINKSLPRLHQKGYKYCEGGFIFEENLPSMAFVQRILHRCYGTKPEPYREFALFETTLK